ncbi:MAG: accessory gene regulator B family protein [Methanocorpusculum sp.]|nr:accessory gene regulator B family protein [Methanocorpusculum sp.]MDD3270938.1 accessory gene regulator B family protein [Syntrophomonadaceae bacterium]MDD4562237.1 accessory gene regulator B family protein [Syntrophomonadaceae bacterium]
MISSICRKIAEALGRKLESDSDQIAIFTYSLEILLGTMIKFTLIIILAILFGILKTALIALFTFSLFRWLGGGIHLSTYLKCLIAGLFLVLGMGYVATLQIDELYLIFLYLFSVLTAVYVIIYWVPAGTDKKQIKDIQKRVKQKKETLVALIIWSTLVFLCICNNLYSYALAGIFGSICSSFFMMPMGYQFIGTLDNLITNSKGGGEGV